MDEAAVKDALDSVVSDLRRIVAPGPYAVFAVLDGALVDDLPSRLERAGLVGRSLYKADTPTALSEVGPWMVDLGLAPLGFDGGDASDGDLAALSDGLAEAMRRNVENGGDANVPPFGGMACRLDPEGADSRVGDLATLLQDAPNAAVFWIVERPADVTHAAAHEAVWRHVRSLNRVLVPPSRSSTGGNAATDERGGTDGRGETGVLFRHADGNVLAEFVPVLDDEQHARFVGPAAGLTFIAPDYPWAVSGTPLWRVVPGERRTATAGANGPIRLRLEQMNEIEALQRTKVFRHLAGQLLASSVRRTHPDHSDAAFRSKALAIVERGHEGGLIQTRALYRYAWLTLASDVNIDDVLDDPNEPRQFRERSRDMRVHLLFEQVRDSLAEAA